MPLSNHALSLARRIGMLVLAFAAVVVWVSMGSPERAADNYINEIDAIMRKDRENQGATDSVQQQQAATGWTSRNLLALTARIEAAGSRDDDRIAALLMLLMLGVAWHSLTSPRYPHPEDDDEDEGEEPADERTSPA